MRKKQDYHGKTIDSLHKMLARKHSKTASMKLVCQTVKRICRYNKYLPIEEAMKYPSIREVLPTLCSIVGSNRESDSAFTAGFKDLVRDIVLAMFDTYPDVAMSCVVLMKDRELIRRLIEKHKSNGFREFAREEVWIAIFECFDSIDAAKYIEEMGWGTSYRRGYVRSWRPDGTFPEGFDLMEKTAAHQRWRIKHWRNLFVEHYLAQSGVVPTCILET